MHTMLTIAHNSKYFDVAPHNVRAVNVALHHVMLHCTMLHRHAASQHNAMLQRSYRSAA